MANYNQACDDWEKWLPTEEDIKDILILNIRLEKLSKKQNAGIVVDHIYDLAKAIS